MWDFIIPQIDISEGKIWGFYSTSPTCLYWNYFHVPFNCWGIIGEFE